MYDHERLHIDQRNARLRDPCGLRTNNVLEWEAKLDQLREMVEQVQDPAAQFILAEILENIGGFE